MQQIPDPNQPPSQYQLDSVDSYVDYHTRMVGSSKEIARISQEMVSQLWLRKYRKAIETTTQEIKEWADSKQVKEVEVKISFIRNWNLHW